MWLIFIAAVALGLVCLYAPGYLMARAFVTRAPALVCAPIISLVEFNAIAVVYAQLGVFCSWASVVMPCTVLGIMALLARLFIAKKPSAPISWGFGSPTLIAGRTVRHFDAIALVLFTAASCFITLYIFAFNLYDLNSFVQEYDNVNHLGLIRNHSESGNWSPFYNSMYFGSEGDAPLLAEGGGFYPSSWILIATLIAQTLGVQPAIAENAANFLFVAFVYPWSMFGLLRCVFRARPLVAACGSVCVLAFAAFPWRLMLFGPLYPNMAAYALVPAVAMLFVVVFDIGATRSSRAVAGALTLVGVAALALTQPNAVFTVALFLVPFCMYRCSLATDRFGLAGAKRVVARVAAAAGFLLFATLVWIALLNAPFLQGVLSEWWQSYTGSLDAFLSALSLGFVSDAAQPVLACLVVAGGVFSLFRREYLWLVVSYALFCFMFCLDAFNDSDLKLWLTGFWYTDKFRIAAAAAMFGVPLASMGLYAVAKGVGRAVTGGRSRRLHGSRAVAVPATVAAFLAVLVYLPNVGEAADQGAETAFGKLGASFASATSPAAPCVYDQAEREFVEKVKSVVPEGEVIVNLPHDGSAFAYVQDGLEVYYRNARGYSPETEKPESAVLRNSLYQVASNGEVRSAVKAVGARYVLLLDIDGPTDSNRFLFTYEEPNWMGLSRINDSTPGFEVVLSEGDMRLYRIAEI